MLTVFTACFGYGASAQVDVHVNIGLQPAWGPAGYDYAEYYYIPDIDAYYDVSARQYVYFDNNVWVTRPYLPPQYRGYDLYRGYKVVINEPRPWMHHDRYRGQYAQYRGHYGQRIIRDDHRNARNYSHERSREWYGGHGHWDDHGRGRGHEEHGNGHGYGHEGHGGEGHGGGHGRR